MANRAPHWINAPEFDWRPERPFDAENTPKPAPKTPAPKTPANDDAKPTPSMTGSSPARYTAGYLFARLVIGLAQGLGLLSLGAGYGDSALGLLLLFAPLILLAGLGRVPGKLLLPWTLIVSLGLVALGFYQQWRAPGETGIAVAVIAGLFLFIAQIFVLVWAKTGGPFAAYRAYYENAWPLVMQIVLCAVAAAAGIVLTGPALAYMRLDAPGPHPAFPATLAVTVCVAVMSWLASPRLTKLLARGLVAFLTLALPLLILLAGAAGIAGVARHWQPPLLLCLGFGALLLICLNASYRDGGTRPRWRQRMEFAAAFALTAPVLLGAAALSDRVTESGWTSLRIFAAAALSLLTAYTLFYMASALIALGGGAWMKRIERANLGLALIALALLAALATPIADPARLAVASQRQRLEAGHVAAADFDFAWLRAGGGRFGHAALEDMAARKSFADQARGAFLALIAKPDATRPPPTEIGANIDVRTPKARLPDSLLTRDWSQVKTPGVPPCLTTAAPCDAYFMDLNGDGKNEIVLVYGNSDSWWAGVMKQGPSTADNDGGWFVAGTLAAPSCAGSLEALRAGRFSPVAPRPGWQDLLVGGTRLAVVPNGEAAACPTP